MKVKAIQCGVHGGRRYEPGEVFEIDDKPHLQYKVDAYGNLEKDRAGDRIVEREIPALAPWMEKVAETKADRRSEIRDTGEAEQHKAEKKGWAI